MLAVQVLTSEKRANQLSPGGPHAYKNGHVMMNFGSDVIYLLHTHTRMNVCMCILIQMGANLSFSCYGFLANNCVFSCGYHRFTGGSCHPILRFAMFGNLFHITLVFLFVSFYKSFTENFCKHHFVPIYNYFLNVGSFFFWGGGWIGE